MAVVDGDGNFLKNGDSNGNAKFTSVTRVSAGKYDFVWTPALSSIYDYNVMLTRVHNHPLEGEIIIDSANMKTTGFRVINANDDAGISDPTAFYVIVFQ